MKVIDPVKFTSSMLVSTTAVESTAAWVSTTTYAAGAKVKYGDRLYESLIATNLNKVPSTNPTSWLDVGPINTLAMFDDQTSTSTTATSSLEVVLSPGVSVTSIGLVGLTGTTATINMLDAPGGNIVYMGSFDLQAATVTDWYEYFFNGFYQKESVVALGLPSYPNSQITINISSASGGSVGIGNVVFGTAIDIGKAMYGLRIGTEDYSKVETDEFGTTTLVKRKSVKTESLEVFFAKSRGRAIFKLMDDLAATPTLWVPSEDDSDLDFLNVYGIRKSFDLAVDYPLELHCSLELRGMT